MVKVTNFFRKMVNPSTINGAVCLELTMDVAGIIITLACFWCVLTTTSQGDSFIPLICAVNETDVVPIIAIVVVYTMVHVVVESTWRRVRALEELKAKSKQ